MTDEEILLIIRKIGRMQNCGLACWDCGVKLERSIPTETIRFCPVCLANRQARKAQKNRPH